MRCRNRPEQQAVEKIQQQLRVTFRVGGSGGELGGEELDVRGAPRFERRTKLRPPSGLEKELITGDRRVGIGTDRAGDECGEPLGTLAGLRRAWLPEQFLDGVYLLVSDPPERFV